MSQRILNYNRSNGSLGISIVQWLLYVGGWRSHVTVGKNIIPNSVTKHYPFTVKDPKCICINRTKCVALCCVLRGTKPSPSNSSTQSDLINDNIYSFFGNECNSMEQCYVIPVMHVYLDMSYIIIMFILICYTYIYICFFLIFTDSTSTNPFNNVCNFCIRRLELHLR